MSINWLIRFDYIILDWIVLDLGSIRGKLFIPDTIYKRSLIHDEYGGNRQGGISSSAQTPNIFIFTGSGGKQHGYKDAWENLNVFSYTGEGQVGDMKFTKGNLALKEHLNSGKRVFLFEYVRSAHVKFVTELEFYDTGYFETHDRNGELRLGIKFFFKRIGVTMYYSPEDLDPEVKDKEGIYAFIEPNKTEREGLVRSRVGQGAYRKSLLHRWEYKCAVTGFNNPKILIASHIVPWKDATDGQRLDVDNGILLSPDFDALFDKHLISFEQSGKIILSDQIEINAFQRLGISGKEVVNNLSDGNRSYLNEHVELLV